MGLINNAVKNIKISHKLYLGFGVVLLLVVLASSLSAMRFHDIRIIYEKTNLIYNINIEVFQAKINRPEYFYTPDDATQTVLSNFIKHASELTQSAHSLPWRPEEQNDLQTLERILADFQQAIKEMSQASQHTVALKKQIAELDGQDAIQRFRDAIAAQPLGLSEYQRADDIAYLSAALRQLASTLYQSDSNDVAQALDARYQAAQQAYQAVLPTLPAETHGLLDELWRYTQRYVALHQEHHSAMATLNKTENAVKVGGDKSRAVIKSLIASIKDQNDRLAYGSAYITLVIGAIAVLIGIVITFYIVRQISRPVQRNLALAERIASGDLTTTIQSDSNDELGRLTAAMAQMNSRLHHVIADVRDSVSRVSSSAAEIAAGNSDLASRTEQQSAAVVETAASMEQLTSTVKNNTDNARHASQIASEAAQNAQKGGEVVRNVVTTMDDIAASARKIADITTVINGIAFQTNILALNAAVEAARAGEQGRGFAVVAGEVRALSQRSSQAAKDIAALINESVERTGVGSKLVAEAGQSMESIVNSVARVNDIMEEISSASEEQSRGIEQISRAITELDSTTQQNATRVSASSSSANTLEEQAIVLAQLMATFRPGDSETAPPSRLARPATQALPAKTPVAGNAQDWTHF